MDVRVKDLFEMAAQMAVAPLTLGVIEALLEGTEGRTPAERAAAAREARQGLTKASHHLDQSRAALADVFDGLDAAVAKLQARCEEIENG